MDSSDEQMYEYMDHFKPFARDCLIVRDHETSSLLPFNFRKGQEILHNVAEKQRRELGKVRILNLKSRRYGGSTYVEGRFYWLTSLNFNRNTFIVAHEEESTNTLFRMAKLFHERNPLGPSIVSSNAQELRFDNKDGTGLKSEYRLATARNVHAGKSQGIHYLHVSEEAMFQGQPEELLTSLFACIPQQGHTEIYRESTAQGFGNTFAEDIFETYAEGAFPYYIESDVIYAWKSPKSDWVLVFIPWFIVEHYTKPFNNQKEKEEFLDRLKKPVFDKENMVWVESEGLRLKNRFKLSLEQLHWREDRINTECRGSVDLFHQNYPSTVEEAFLSSGSNFFGKELCDRLEKQCKDPLVIGDLHRMTGKTRIKHNDFGSFRIWEKCKPEDSYYITVDVAGGRAMKRWVDDQHGKEPDRTNIDVWNHRTGNQAAQWNGHIPYDQIADMVMMIGELYGIMVNGKVDLPLAAVELNNHGYTVVASLQENQYPQYEIKGQPGWLTNRRTKPAMCDSLYKAARDAELLINSRETVSEMRIFVEKDGEFGAAGGGKDDRVITAAIAAEIQKTIPRKYHDLRRGRKNVDIGFKNWDNRNKATQESSYVEYYV